MLHEESKSMVSDASRASRKVRYGTVLNRLYRAYSILIALSSVHNVLVAYSIIVNKSQVLFAGGSRLLPDQKRNPQERTCLVTIPHAGGIGASAKFCTTYSSDEIVPQ